MNRPSHHPPRPRITAWHGLPALLVASLALAACVPTVGSEGPVATPPATDPPSVEPPSPDLTPATSPTPSSPSASPTADPSADPGGETIVRAYFFLEDSSGGEPKLVPVLRSVPQTRAVATAAMNALLAGPMRDERDASPRIFSTVPDGTALLGIAIADGIATVDLSAEFESGGGSAGVIGRLAQVVFTLTQFRTVEAVTFRVDGRDVSVFSSEGIVLDRPVGREDYRESQPEIFVDRPAWGAAIGNPARVAGLTRVFEATFLIDLFDGEGRTLERRVVTATCGTGCWGTFDESIPYDVAKPQWGTLRVLILEASDGEPGQIRDYPVWLTPAR